MSEAPSPPADEAIIGPAEPKPFAVEAEANGLSYILVGTLPEEPSSFVLVASLPEPVWAQMSPAIEAKERTDDFYGRQYNRLKQLDLGDGKVGSVLVTKGQSPDGAPTIVVNRIQTDNRYLLEDSEYFQAGGIGSLLMDNLCAFADVRGWRISLFPDTRSGGKLDTWQLVEWYAKRGFKFQYEDRENESVYESSNDMVRVPTEPDESQPIMRAIS